MPSINVELNSPHERHIQEDVPERSANDALLYDLQAQVRIIGGMSPSLSALAELYQQRKSRIDQFAEWYSNKSHGEKLWLGGTVVSVSYLVGAFIGVAWLLTGLVTALYATATAIIEEHAELVRQRDTLFLDDIPKMEASLKTSIESFCVLGRKITMVFKSLNELTMTRSEGIFELKENVGVMRGHNLRYTSLIEALGEVAEKLSAHQNGVALDKAELDGMCTELQNRLQEAEALTSTLTGLVTTVEQELKTHVSSESLGLQGGDVEAPSISDKTAAHFTEIDREIELHRNPNKVASTSHTVSVSHADEDFSDFDQALKEIQRADSVSKACHQSRSEKNSGGYAFAFPSLF
tara:strand:- start:10886 stop:11938 length:1053 start_codon:yes stop_codon:yes gene_type:complete